MPETTEIIRKIELERSAMNTYKHLVRDSFAELQNSEITVTNVLTKILRLSQLTGGFLGDDEGKKEELYSSLKNAGYGDLVVETVNPSSLSAFVKEQIAENENELPEWLSGLINIFERNTVSTRKYTK